MPSRADVLGALLDGDRLQESTAREDQARSNAHVAQVVAGERKRLGSLPDAASFEANKHPRGAAGSGQGGKFVKKGSSGAPVKAVQKRLGVAQTGSFAFDTQAAVENFQRERGLQVDGVVGAQTAQALLGNRNAKAVSPGALSSADAKALGVTSTRKAAVRKPSAPTRSGGGIVV